MGLSMRKAGWESPEPAEVLLAPQGCSQEEHLCVCVHLWVLGWAFGIFSQSWDEIQGLPKEILSLAPASPAVDILSWAWSCGIRTPFIYCAAFGAAGLLWGFFHSNSLSAAFAVNLTQFSFFKWKFSVVNFKENVNKGTFQKHISARDRFCCLTNVFCRRWGAENDPSCSNIMNKLMESRHGLHGKGH